MELADAKGPDVAQSYTLARLTPLVSHVQWFTPLLSPEAADLDVARGFIGAYLRQQDRCLEDEKVAVNAAPTFADGNVLPSASRRRTEIGRARARQETVHLAA